jgi:drug/metabolite transporter (DMT)-like permease
MADKRSLLTGTVVDNPPLAASLLIGALFLLGLQDALIKFTSSEISLWQFQFFRSAFNLLLLFVFLRSLPPAPHRTWAVVMRSLFLCAAMICFFSGIPFLSLANMAAALYVFPLFVALLSGLVLGEKVGPRRVVAIIVGFAGTLLILKPGTDSFTLMGLMPVAAALFYACTILTTRKLCREESPVTLSCGVAISFLILGSLGMLVFTNEPFGDYARAWPYIFTGWREVEMWVYGIIAVCSTLNLTANTGLAKAYQSAEPSWLASFDYSYLVFATFWGFVIWRDIPDSLMFAGMFMIAGAGAFVAWRERQEKRLPVAR